VGIDIWRELARNQTLWISLSAWAVAQLIKIIIEFIHTKKFNKALLVSSGGMPSSHSALVMAMVVSVGYADGFDSPVFGLALIMCFIVMYDAAGVRRAAGNQAAAINILFHNMENSGIKLDKNLKELLGHSPLEVVAGAVLGIVIAFIGHNVIY